MYNAIKISYTGTPLFICIYFMYSYMPYIFNPTNNLLVKRQGDNETEKGCVHMITYLIQPYYIQYI